MNKQELIKKLEDIEWEDCQTRQANELISANLAEFEHTQESIINIYDAKTGFLMFEVKEAKSEIPKNAWETVSAFYNTAGGWIVFGVGKKGKEYEILGVNNPEKIECDFLTTLRGGKFNKVLEANSKK